MKIYAFITVFLFLATCSNVFSQGSPIKKDKSRFILNGIVLKPSAMLMVMEPYPDAYGIMEKAKANYAAASFFASAGGFMVGWTIGSLIGPSKPTWGLGAAGGGLIFVGVAFSSSYLKHAGKAMELYNSQTVTGRSVQLDVGLGVHGLGMRLNF